MVGNPRSISFVIPLDLLLLSEEVLFSLACFVSELASFGCLAGDGRDLVLTVERVEFWLEEACNGGGVGAGGD